MSRNISAMLIMGSISAMARLIILLIFEFFYLIIIMGFYSIPLCELIKIDAFMSCEEFYFDIIFKEGILAVHISDAKLVFTLTKGCLSMSMVAGNPAKYETPYRDFDIEARFMDMTIKEIIELCENSFDFIYSAYDIQGIPDVIELPRPKNVKSARYNI